MTSRARRHAPPAWPYVLLLAAWGAGTWTIGAEALARWHGAGGGPLVGALLVVSVLASSVGFFYLLGFAAKGLAYPFMVHGAARADETPDTAETPPLVVLYLTAGDFDALAVETLLHLETRGPAKFILHDDGNDEDARRRMQTFVNAHPARARWDVEILHRPERRGGKAGAVNWVMERLDDRWEWMLLCDSDSIGLERDAVLRASTDMTDESVAVIQCRNVGYSDPDDPDFQRRIAPAIDVFDAFATPQAAWGYLPFFGHNAFVRVADLRALNGLTTGFFSDDLDFSARLTLNGRGIRYRRDIVFGERQPGDWSSFRKRARKWAFGCMQVVRARAAHVFSRPGIPFAHRVGLLEFMGFYPAQALLFAGLLIEYLILPWLAPSATPGAALVWGGACVAAALLAPTAAWAIAEGRLAQWPALAWSCVLVYGGSLTSTVRGVVDGLSTRERPWIPTNLGGQARRVPAAAWLECALGAALIGVPWIRGGAMLASPASYLFFAVFLYAPLTAAAYHDPERRPARPAGARVARAGAGALVALLALMAIAVAPASATPRAKASGKAILVDGAPFQVRGVDYSPWPPKTAPGVTPYPGAALVDHDLDSIERMGANTVLVQGAPGWVIEHAKARGLFTVYAFYIAWNDTTRAAFDRQSDAIVAAVDTLKGHDAVLAWILGNEVPPWVVNDVGAKRVEARLRSLAERVRQHDPGRLLGHANWPPTRNLDLSFLDLACFNLYPAWPYEVAVKGFGPYLRDVLMPIAGNRPLLITEFGINSLEAGEARQARVITDCWNDIASSRIAGGIVFEWSDEWWKNFDNPIGDDYWKRAYAPNDAMRHDKDPEEYYGIVTAERVPKPAYAALKEAWSGSTASVPWWPALILLLLGLGAVAALGIGRRRTRTRGEHAAGPHAGSALLIALLLALPRTSHASAPFGVADTLIGVDSNDQFGWGLGPAGDQDGDSLGDVAIGARFHLVGVDTAAGAVYVYGHGPAGVPHLIQVLEGTSSDEHFGESVTGGLDVSGDHLPDLAVGAPLRDGPGGTAAGAVDLFRGGALGAGPWATLWGEAKDDWFGQSIAIGDLDGDGIADIAVGAPYNDRAASAAGAVFIYRGGSPPTTPWLVLTGEAANDQFGWSVAYAGDVDGDGYGDLVVGARLFGAGLMAARGKVYLFRGGPGMDAVADGAWLGVAKDDWFGNSVAGPGDVDGGGKADVLVGAPYNDAGGSAAGAAYLFRGEDPPGSAPVAVYIGEAPNAQFGWSVGAGGDVNGGGRPDVVVGARLQPTPSGSASGRIYCFTGESLPSTAAAYVTDGQAANDWFGNAVAGAGAYFQFGRSGAVGGAPYDDTGATDAGNARVLGLAPSAAVNSPRMPAGTFRIWPNPVFGMARLFVPGVGAQSGTFEVFDAAGRRLRRLAATRVDGGWGAAWDGRGDDGARLRTGLYWVRFSSGRTLERGARVVLLN